MVQNREWPKAAPGFSFYEQHDNDGVMNTQASAKQILDEIEKEYREECKRRGLSLDVLIKMLKQPPIDGHIKAIESTPPTDENLFHGKDYLRLISVFPDDPFLRYGCIVSLPHVGANPLGVLLAAQVVELSADIKKLFKNFL